MNMLINNVSNCPFFILQLLKTHLEYRRALCGPAVGQILKVANWSCSVSYMVKMCTSKRNNIRKNCDL